MLIVMVTLVCPLARCFFYFIAVSHAVRASAISLQEYLQQNKKKKGAAGVKNRLNADSVALFVSAVILFVSS